MDLPVPLPVADSAWLWTWPAPDPPVAAPHPEDPPGRLLLLLDERWTLTRVLATLRPGAGVVDAVLGPEPLLGEQPFGDHPLYRVDPNGRHVTLVQREHQIAAWMTVYRVTRIGLDGDTLFHVERRATMRPVTDATFDATVAEFAARPGTRAAFPAPAAAREALVRGMLRRSVYHAPVSDVQVGLDGTTWLRWPDTRDGPVRFEVLDARGEPLYTFEADRRMEILTAHGDSVWALIRGQGDDPSELVLFRLERVEAGGVG
jgi:hypothetical protein